MRSKTKESKNTLMKDRVYHAYPWQQAVWQQLQRQLLAKRLPHALMFVGAKDIGKFHFARAFAQFLLCQSPINARSCGHCQPCRLASHHVHPDLLEIVPDEGKRIIRIEQIRAINERVNTTAQFSGYRIIIISPIERLNEAASNALLKNLEEPGEKTIFILVNKSGMDVLATIKSRCQRISFAKPQEREVKQWLRLQVGDEVDHEQLLKNNFSAPLKALENYKNNSVDLKKIIDELLKLKEKKIDVLVLAKNWEDDFLSERLSHWMVLLNDLLKCKLVNKNKVQTHLSYSASLNTLLSMSTLLSIKAIITMIDQVKQALFFLETNVNVNRLLLIENTLIQWQLSE